MSLVRKRMQSIMLPVDESFADCERLFINPDMGFSALDYKPLMGWRPRVEFEMVFNDRKKWRAMPVEGHGVTMNRDEGYLDMKAGSSISFCTYLNTCSVRKWKTLTNIKDIFLRIEAEGSFVLVVNEYVMDGITRKHGVDESFRSFEMEARDPIPVMLEGRETFEVSVGYSKAVSLGFEIYACTDCKIYGGVYEAEIDEADINDTDILISSTTFKKEEYITRNVEIIKKEIFESDDELADHLRMFVVDNGMTLDADAISNDKITVFPNVNAGGAGGFARGMIEALRLDRKPTHILLMDDDVLFMPEAFKRTYALLSMLKDRYKGRFISGCMLELENKHLMHEDVGFFHGQGYYASKKGSGRDMTNIHTFVQNEVDWFDFGHEYAAWWFCCIPMKYVTEQSLPLPFFVRCDDVEFSMRSNPGTITLNGISVWHMGFGNKFSASMEFYQVIRNSLAMQAFLGNCNDVEIYERVEFMFRNVLSKYAYSHADLLLDAVEDFLKGPSIYDLPNGADVIREKGKKNEVLSPISDFEEYAELANDEYTYALHSSIKDAILGKIWNGYGLPGFLIKDEVGSVELVNVETVGRYFLKRRILAIDPRNRQAIMREYDEQKFAEVYKRSREVFGRYKSEHEKVEAEYRSKAGYYRSIEFWKGYLGIE